MELSLETAFIGSDPGLAFNELIVQPAFISDAALPSSLLAVICASPLLILAVSICMVLL